MPASSGRQVVLRRFRALLALALFALGGGAEQLLDAVLYHRGVAPVEQARVNAGDQCHSERCELGAPIATPPPAEPPPVDGRLEPPVRRTAGVRFLAALRATPAARAHAPRAPPSLS
jgi:hypothetical protein